MKKICVVTLNIEFDDTYTDPKDWSWEGVVNRCIIDFPPRERDNYYCSTQLVNCQYFDVNKSTIDKT
jgi:hypothetical protein